MKFASYRACLHQPCQRRVNKKTVWLTQAAFDDYKFPSFYDFSRISLNSTFCSGVTEA